MNKMVKGPGVYSRVLRESPLKLQIETHRETDLLKCLQAWADEIDPDGRPYNRTVLTGRNSWFFQDAKPFFYVLLEDNWSEMVRGRTRVDALAQALQVIETWKPKSRR